MNRPAIALDASPPMHELRTAAALGMTYRAWCAAGKPASRTPVEKPRAVRLWHPYRSKWEADYAKHLDLQLSAGLILGWTYEAIVLEIGVGAHYTPDFPVTLPDGSNEMREVKGYRREAAIVRIKAAALRYPQFRFVLVTKRNGEWHHTTIGGTP